MKYCLPQSNQHRFHFNTQRGDFLLESLIGMVLMAIIGMGVVYVTGKISNSQKDMRMQEIVVNRLRAALIQNGTDSYNVCADASLGFELPNGEQVTVEKQGCDGTNVATTTALINGQTISNIPQPIFLKATSTSIDEIVVGGTWQ